LQNRYVFGTGLDEPLVQVSSGGTLTYLHADRQGSIVATTDATGTVTNKSKYSPFGENAPVGTTFGFTAQRYDAETGLYYYKIRYYSPSIGRFLQPDKIGYAGGDLNLYAYVRNDPLKFTDWSGLGPSQGTPGSPWNTTPDNPVILPPPNDGSGQGNNGTGTTGTTGAPQPTGGSPTPNPVPSMPVPVGPDNTPPTGPFMGGFPPVGGVQSSNPLAGKDIAPDTDPNTGAGSCQQHAPPKKPEELKATPYRFPGEPQAPGSGSVPSPPPFPAQ